MEEKKDATEVQDSSPDTENEEVTETDGEPSQEGDKNAPDAKPQPNPLHRDERFREVYKGFKEGQRKIQELEQRLTELSSRPSQPTEPDKVPSWFTRAFGDNPELYQEYRESAKSDREAVKAELRDELRKESETETRADKEAQRFLEDQLDDMEADGLEYDRNALLKFAYENPVVGEDGSIDLRKTLALMDRVSPPQGNPTVEQRKRISATSRPAGGDPKPDKVFTDKDFAGKGWGGLR